MKIQFILNQYIKKEKWRAPARRETNMKEDICSIPINEVLEVQDGCPICRMHDTLENHMLDFIMGAAMMEPDVRTETNRSGFCGAHSLMMLGRKNRLGLALILESRLKSVEQEILAKKAAPNKKGMAQKGETCYVCARVDTALDALLTTFFKLWVKEPEFRENVAKQPIICLPHYTMLLSKAQAALDKKSFAGFQAVLSDVMRRGLLPLEEELSGFCRMFDYHNIGADWGNKKDAPERAVTFLTGYKKS